MIHGRLLSRKIYLFAAFHLAPLLESQKLTANKPFAIFSKIFWLTQTPEFDITVTVVTYVL